jgi:hypothetical protein
MIRGGVNGSTAGEIVLPLILSALASVAASAKREEQLEDPEYTPT